MPQTLHRDDPLVTLLTDFRTMTDRHRAGLAPYLDIDGYVDEDHRRAHTRRDRTDALEARQLLQQAMSLLARRHALPDGLRVTVPGTDGHHHALTTGVLDDAARETFLSGQCHALARALSDHTGWPMAVIISDECSFDPDRCGPESVTGDVCACQLEHLVVIRPDGAYVDITGAHLPDSLLDDEDQDVIAVTDAVWNHITRSPLWRRPALDVAATLVPQLVATLERERGAA